jgi:hypothetical protein
MPSASDEQRALMTKWFGSCDTQGPEDLLRSHGWSLLPNWYWVLPTSSHTINKVEWECFTFLIDEWDYGGIIDESKATEVRQDSGEARRSSNDPPVGL